MHAADDNVVVIAIQLCHRTDADGRRLMLFEWVGDDRIRAVAPRRLDRSDLRCGQVTNIATPAVHPRSIRLSPGDHSAIQKQADIGPTHKSLIGRH